MPDMSMCRSSIYARKIFYLNLNIFHACLLLKQAQSIPSTSGYFFFCLHNSYWFISVPLKGSKNLGGRDIAVPCLSGYISSIPKTYLPSPCSDTHLPLPFLLPPHRQIFFLSASMSLSHLQKSIIFLYFKKKKKTSFITK